MIAQTSKNEVTGNTQITVDEADLKLIQRALWDEQINLAHYMRQYPDQRERLWGNLSEQWIPLAEALGGGVPFKNYDEIIRKGIEDKR